MGYFDYLKQQLRPLGIYELNYGAGAEELFVVGAQLDEIFLALEELSREMILTDAQGYGLENYEQILPYTPAFITTEDEQRALMALLRIREGSFSLALLEDTVSGCGINAVVEEGVQTLTARVRFPDNRGVPQGFPQIRDRIEQILPSHVGIEYFFIYALWQELMEAFPLWSGLSDSGMTWGQVEIYL